jgi:outer membrane protein assembly factor BamB
MKSCRFLPVVILLIGGLMLGSCGLFEDEEEPTPTDLPAPPSPEPSPTLVAGADVTPRPTESPWQTGTPSPMLAPLSDECLAQGSFPPQLERTRYGANVFLFHTDMERVLSLTNIGGFGWIRQQIHWRDMEGEREQFVWKPLDQVVSAARARNFQVLLSIVRSPPWATADGNTGLPDDPETLAEFMGLLATRYRGRVAAYQIWNEPNLSHENGGTPADPAEYLALLEAVYPAIKQADPCALVVSAALAATNNPDPGVATDDLPFFNELYTLNDGAFLRVADVVGAHTGAGPYAPDARWAPEEPYLSHHYFRHIERMREIMQNYGDQRQVWLTEYGWTVTRAEGAPPPVTEEQQATYLVDAMWRIRHRYPWLSGVFVWNINFSVIAPPDDEKTTYSVLEPDWSLRPAFLSLQNSVHALRDVDRAPFVPDDTGYTYRWTFPGRGSMSSAPLLAPDGTLYVLSDPGTIYAVNARGQMEWQFNAAGTVTAVPAMNDEGLLALGNSNSQVAMVGTNGALLWRNGIYSPPRGSPVFVGDSVAVVDSVGNVTAFDMSGQEAWAFEAGAESTPLARTSDGALLLVNARGEAFKLDAAGQMLWSARLGGEFWAAPVPDAAGGAYVVTVGGRVHAIDSQGAPRWSTPLDASVEAPPLLGSDGRLYVAARNGTLYALDAEDGALLWSYDTGSALAAPPAQGDDGMLYQGTEDERLLAISPDGTRLWQVQVRGTIRARPLMTPQGRLYVPTGGGRLYAFEARQAR